MSKDQFTKGISKNNIPYVRWGSGKKLMMIFTGGPGNLLPGKPGMMTKMYDPYLKEYSIVMVARKMNLHEGSTTEDFADDYAEMIRSELRGKVHTILGESFGGMILMHFAAKYESLCEKIVILISANQFSEKGNAVDMEFARLQSIGKPRKAAMKIAEALSPPGIGLTLFKGMFWLIGNGMVDSTPETYANDIMIEAHAEKYHDASANLRKISVPVLMIGGDSDIYIPIENIRETAALIDDCQLIIYEGKGHMNTMSDKRLIKDIEKFIYSETPAPVSL